ncbi:MAG: pseudouridine synthase, partial [Oscillospiraceae bacterium]|nr:pseudouridine synthase [Oscillospiraceae bacterium]
MEKIRLQKLIAESGMCSRRKAEELIKQGKVTVNGRAAHIGDGATVKDVIAVDGEKLPMAKKREKYYIMLNKPRGYVTTMSDELDRRCVTELLKDFPARVYPVGRLDRNSEGLLLFTNDGNFSNDIMHPSR